MVNVNSQNGTQNYVDLVSGEDITLVQENCHTVLDDLPDESVDLVITDPPYGIEFDSDRYQNADYGPMENDDGFDHLQELGEKLYRVLKENTHCYVFCNQNVVDQFKEAFSSSDLTLDATLIWDKDDGGHGMGDTGDYAPRHEVILKYSKGRRELNGKRLPDVLRFKPVKNTGEEKQHPTQKPVQLIETLVKKSSDKGELVCDPFMGSGTTGVAARKTGRRFLGIEIDEDYLRTAEKRITGTQHLGHAGKIDEDDAEIIAENIDWLDEEQRIGLIDPRLLKPHERHLYVYGEDEGIPEHLEQDFEENGIIEDRLIIKRDGTLCSGHKRWLMMLKNGRSQVEVKIVEYEDKADERLKILSADKKRRLSFSQLARKIMELWDIAEEQGGTTRQEVAKHVDESDRTCGKVKHIWEAYKDGDEKAEELVERLDNEELGVDGAKKELELWNEAQDGNDEAKELLAEVEDGKTTASKAHEEYRKRKEQSESNDKRRHDPTATTVQQVNEKDWEDGELPENRVLQGNALERLRQLPDNSIDCIVTSPPYYGLRSYPLAATIWDEDDDCDHEWIESETPPTDDITDCEKYEEPESGMFCVHCHGWCGQLGQEPTPDMYVDHLVQIFKEAKRVLKPTGSLFINIDDTYNNGGSYTPETIGTTKVSGAVLSSLPDKKAYVEDLPKKCRMGIPERFKLRMIEKGWICRNDIIWDKAGGKPNSVKCRRTNTHEMVYHFVNGQDYYFDLDTIREPLRQMPQMDGVNGKNPGSIVRVPSVRTKDDSDKPHVARYPPELAEQFVLPACPMKVCTGCGTPYRRNIESRPHDDLTGAHEELLQEKGLSIEDVEQLGRLLRVENGWEQQCDCETDETEPGIVLDPFMGSGSTGIAAKRHGRRWLGIELCKEWAEGAEATIKNEPTEEPENVTEINPFHIEKDKLLQADALEVMDYVAQH